MGQRRFQCGVVISFGFQSCAKAVFIIGDPAANGPGTAYVRPDSFTVGPEGGPGFGARVRDVLLAGPDARIDCVLDDDGSIEVRVAHEVARKLAPKNRISLMPTSVRVWAAPTP